MSRKLEEIREMLCEELDKIADKGELSAGSLELVDKLTHSIKSIDTIMAMEEAGYSERGYSYNWRNGDMRGNSNARGRRNAPRDARGRYSGDGYSYAEDGMHEILADMREMMQDLPTSKQREVRDFIDKMERMERM